MQARRTRWGRSKQKFRRIVGGMLLAVFLPGLLSGAGWKTPAYRYHFPLSSTEWRISDPYGMRLDPFTGRETFHNGIDLACAAGTGVLAVQDGVVRVAVASESYGNYLCIAHPDGNETRYAHLQYLYVRPGEIVQGGQLLGTAGQTGRATGPHLHLELRKQGTACDPSALLENAP